VRQLVGLPRPARRARLVPRGARAGPGGLRAVLALTPTTRPCAWPTARPS
jgi:hypothetical protein